MFKNITFGDQAKKIIIISISLSIITVLLSAALPLVLKIMVNNIINNSEYKVLSVFIFVLLFFSYYVISEARWWVFSMADYKNYLKHVTPLMKNKIEGIRIHKSGIGNRTFISTLIFSFLPSFAEIFIASIIIYTFISMKISLVIFFSSFIQLMIGSICYLKLDGLVTLVREKEVIYFNSINNGYINIDEVRLLLHDWYKEVIKLNLYRVFVKFISLIFPSLGLVYVNFFYIYGDYSQASIVGDLLAINTYILQNTFKVESANMAVKNIVQAKNDVKIAFTSS